MLAYTPCPVSSSVLKGGAQVELGIYDRYVGYVHPAGKPFTLH